MSGVLVEVHDEGGVLVQAIPVQDSLVVEVPVAPPVGLVEVHVPGPPGPAGVAGAPGPPGIVSLGIDDTGTPYVDPAGVGVGDDAHLEIIDGHYFAVKDDGSSSVELLVAPALGFGDAVSVKRDTQVFLNNTDVNINWPAPVIAGGTFGWDAAHPDRILILFDCLAMLTVNVAYHDDAAGAVGHRYIAVGNSTYSNDFYADDARPPSGDGTSTTATLVATGRLTAGDYLQVDIGQTSGGPLTPGALLNLICLGRL